ncbi:MAG: hypothetical protein ACHQK9_04215 [Reyranellales bacterium]
MSSIDAREAYQQDRIQDGRRDSSLTRNDARGLQQGEQRIQRYQARAAADGNVSPAERQRLDGMLNRESGAINRERHDDQRASGGRDGDRGRDGWGHDGREDRRDADRRDEMNRDRDGRNGDHRDADRRDFGRDHNNGSWNQGRDQNGWNRGDHNNTASNGSPHQWNGSHNGTGTTPGTGTTAGTGTTTPATGTHSWNGGSRGQGGTPTGTTAPSTSRSSGGQYTAQAPRTSTYTPRSFTPTAATAPHYAAPTRTASTGGRGFGRR